MIYRRNPLRQVICQLRFPPILRIDARVPDEFQDIIRDVFPDYTEREELDINIPRELQRNIPREVLDRLLQAPPTKNYEFKSEDGDWKVNLTRTFLALTTYDYERWEQFYETLIGPLSALVDVYSPSSYSRIGLRYIDIIERDKLNLTGVSWTELLEPHVLGILGSRDVGESVYNFQSVYEIHLADGQSKVKMDIGFVEAANGEDPHFKIDSDFYKSKKTAISDAAETLDFLRKRGSRLFRWAITERLHEAMEPEPL